MTCSSYRDTVNKDFNKLKTIYASCPRKIRSRWGRHTPFANKQLESVCRSFSALSSVSVRDATQNGSKKHSGCSSHSFLFHHTNTCSCVTRQVEPCSSRAFIHLFIALPTPVSQSSAATSNIPTRPQETWNRPTASFMSAMSGKYSCGSLGWLKG